MQAKTSFPQKIFLMLFGCLLGILLVEGGLRLGGLVLTGIQARANKAGMKKAGAYRILCLGESTTYRQYPHYLKAALNKNDLNKQFEVIDAGRPGVNTDVILSRIEFDLNRYQPDMVVAMMGVNDKGALHLPYERTSSNKIILLFQSLKTYKLVRLLRHLSYKSNSWGLPPQEAEPDEEALRENVQATPGNYRAHILLSRVYTTECGRYPVQHQGKQAEEYVDPVYSDENSAPEQCRYKQAEELLRKAVALKPDNPKAYQELSRIYRLRRQTKQEEQYLKKALQLDSSLIHPYLRLGQIALAQGKLKQAEEYFRKLEQAAPQDEVRQLGLAQHYLYQDQFQLAEVHLQKAIQLNPKNENSYYGLKVLLRHQGRGNNIEKPYDAAQIKFFLAGYKEITARNYLALQGILAKRKIRLVCVQYPMRGIVSLNNIFGDQSGDIVFVDNESVFLEAVKSEGLKAYFVDMFGIDFGHCTPKGNQLLGENIAKVILKEVFGK